MSEAREVNVRKSRLEWCPGMARQFHTKTGTTMPLVMGSNALGFLKIRPITWPAHRAYSHPYADLSDAARSTVAAAFHVQPIASRGASQFDNAYSSLNESDRSAVDRLFMLLEGG